LENDEEHVPHIENVKEIHDVINIEDHIEENSQEAPCCPFEDDEFIEDFIATP
jgi:hypothetical protein